MKIKKSFLALLATASLSVSANAASNVALSLTDLSGTNNSSVNVGSSITYNINVSNLLTYQGTPGLGGYDITVDYPSFLSYQSATLGTNFDVNDNPLIINSSGQVELSNVSFDTAANILASQTGSFTIGTITFNATSLGNGSLTFDPLTSLSDEQGNALVFSTATAQASAVPEPSSVALIALGAGGIFLMAMRRRSQAGV